MRPPARPDLVQQGVQVVVRLKGKAALDRLCRRGGNADAAQNLIDLVVGDTVPQPGLRLLAVDDVMPSNGTIADQSYPLCNDFYAAIRQDSTADSSERKVYDWLSTDAGYACIEKAGYVAAKPMTTQTTGSEATVTIID